jgi:hypothetical protein
MAMVRPRKFPRKQEIANPERNERCKGPEAPCCGAMVFGRSSDEIEVNPGSSMPLTN